PQQALGPGGGEEAQGTAQPRGAPRVRGDKDVLRSLARIPRPEARERQRDGGPERETESQIQPREFFRAGLDIAADAPGEEPRRAEAAYDEVRALPPRARGLQRARGGQ